MLKIILATGVLAVTLIAESSNCNYLIKKMTKDSEKIIQFYEAKQIGMAKSISTIYQINLIQARGECSALNKTIILFNDSEKQLVGAGLLKASSI